ncbi:glycosyltransferase family 4 protein [bacterium]|nr:glycosyltransferase family 4 protein [bacterium]
MKILYISSADDYAGGEVHLLNLMKGMLEHKENVFLACRKNSILKDKVRELNIMVFTLPLSCSIDLYSAYQISNLSKSYNIDIIHAHLGRDYIPAGLSLYIGLPKTKLVLTRHIMLKTKSTFLHKLAFKKVSKFIGVSRSVCNELKKISGIDPNTIVYIPNGVDIDEFERTAFDNSFYTKFNIPHNVPIIGVVGKLSPHKGQADLIKAAPFIIREFPDVHFIFVGDPMKHQEYYSKELEDLAVALKVMEKVHFAGFQSNVPGILKSFTISVIPSWEEPFGLSIIESMAAKIPIVASNSAGASEIIGDGINGFLFTPKEPQSLAGRIIELLSDSAKQKDFALSGFETAKSKYSIENMITKTRDLYLEVLKNN